MNIEIKEITDREDWNNFVLSLHPNTFLQSWEWGDVQEKTGEGILRLGVFEDDKQMGASLVVIVKAKRGRHYLIPHGPLLMDNVSHKNYLRAIIKYLKVQAKKDRTIALRVAPLLVNTPQNVQIFKDLNFRPAPMHVHAELTWVLDISKTEEDILAGMRKTTRHAVRKADAKGVTIEVINDKSALDRFMPLYEKTKTRHGFVPFSRSFIESQLDAFAPDNRFFIVIASYDGKDVAAAILMHFSNTVFYYHGASTKLTSSVPAAQALQWAAIKEAKRRGATNYNFWGIAPDNEPDHPFAGITIFKKGFGGHAVDYLHAQDLPFSIMYWKMWLIDTYRKRKRGF